jgi:hypothetical protein
MMRSLLGLLAVLAVAGGLAWADDKASKDTKPIAAKEAKGHVGETLTVAFKVKHAKDGTHEESYFLDSEADYKDPDNLAVVIAYEHAGAFKKAGIADIVAHYQDKSVRVTGKVTKEKMQTRIRVTDPKQIEVVAAAKTP